MFAMIITLSKQN